MLERPVTQAGSDPKSSQVKQKFFVTEMAILPARSPALLFMLDLWSDPLRAPSRIGLGSGNLLLTSSPKLGSDVAPERRRSAGSSDVLLNSPSDRRGGGAGWGQSLSENE